MASRRDTIELTVIDLVGCLLWDDRKEDDELPREAIEEAIAAGEITQAEIVAIFARAFADGSRAVLDRIARKTS
jgi:hypothetical protein